MNRAPLNYDDMVAKQAHLPMYDKTAETSYASRSYHEAHDRADGMPYAWETHQPKKYP